MAKCMLAFPNRSDTGIVTGAPFAAGLPAANLQTRFLSQYARTTSTVLFNPTPALPDGSQCSMVVNVNFGLARYVTALALVKHNFSLSSQARLILWTDATQTTALYDSAWQPVWPRWYDTTSLRWKSSNFLFGRISLDDFGNVPAIFLQVIQASSGSASAFSAQYASIYVSDPTNTAGFLQAGRLYMAEDWTPTHNFTYGNASISWVDPSVVDTALGGTEYFEPRSMYREVTFTLPYLGLVEGVSKAFGLTRNRGVTGDFLFIWDPAVPQLMQQRSFVGRLESINPLDYPMFNLTSMAFKIKELV